MKITINAMLFAPVWFRSYGGENSAVFTKTTSIEAKTAREIERLKRGKVMISGQILETKSKVKAGGTYSFRGHLPHVTKAFFDKLEKEGWVADKEALKQHGIPSNKRELEMVNSILECKSNLKTYEAAVRSADASLRRFQRFKKQNRDLVRHGEQMASKANEALAKASEVVLNELSKYKKTQRPKL